MMYGKKNNQPPQQKKPQTNKPTTQPHTPQLPEQ